MKQYIFGAGAQGKVIADILQSRGQQFEGFLDEDEMTRGHTVSGHRVLGNADYLRSLGPPHGISLIFALGEAPSRLRLTVQFKKAGYRCFNAVHSRAVISPSATLGSGICVCAGGVVNPDARVGDAVIVNTGATVDHDCEVEDGVHLSPGVHLAGRVHIGPRAFLGVGVSVGTRVHIGGDSIVGAGAVVVNDLPQGVLAVGVPARVVRRLDQPVDWSRLL